LMQQSQLGNNSLNNNKNKYDDMRLKNQKKSHELLSCHSLVDLAAAELEHLRSRVERGKTERSVSPSSSTDDVSSSDPKTCLISRFPNHCLQYVHSIPGNDRCVDCSAIHPEWASVTYGALLCLKCSGRHRSLGVSTSFVRSIYMDHWSHNEILSMMEGGNSQLLHFFGRHNFSSNFSTKRYRTRAALFYRENLALHVSRVALFGKYKGRRTARKQKGINEIPERSRKC